MDARTKLLQEIIFEQNYYIGLDGECLFCKSTESHRKNCLITKAIDALSHITVHRLGQEISILIDRDDYERLSEYKWYLHNTGSIYAYNESRRKIVLQKFILNQDSENASAYNENGDPRDYRKQNLVACLKQNRSARVKRAMVRRQAINQETNDE